MHKLKAGLQSSPIALAVWKLCTLLIFHLNGTGTNHHYHKNPQPSSLGVITYIFWGCKTFIFHGFSGPRVTTSQKNSPKKWWKQLIRSAPRRSPPSWSRIAECHLAMEPINPKPKTYRGHLAWDTNKRNSLKGHKNPICDSDVGTCRLFFLATHDKKNDF